MVTPAGRRALRGLVRILIVGLLAAAANKTPVSDATRSALDALLAGKIN